MKVPLPQSPTIVLYGYEIFGATFCTAVLKEGKKYMSCRRASLIWKTQDLLPSIMMAQHSLSVQGHPPLDIAC